MSLPPGRSLFHPCVCFDFAQHSFHTQRHRSHSPIRAARAADDTRTRKVHRACPASATTGVVSYELDCTVITGEVLDVGEPGDDVVQLRIGPNVTMVEIESRKDELQIGQRITFKVWGLEVYPYEL
ncbi:hypothetical protein ACWDYJ_36095 [Streptomyces sp. NPDC003042]